MRARNERGLRELRTRLEHIKQDIRLIDEIIEKIRWDE